VTLALAASPSSSRCFPRPVGGQDHQLRPAAGGFSASRVSQVVQSLSADTRRSIDANWLAAVCSLVVAARPDLAPQLIDFLGQPPSERNLLGGMSIGEVGVVYEALNALLDHGGRRSSGQYFTPDDTAAFMADQGRSFPEGGMWLDPCTGVGNLAWHLSAAQTDPANFVKQRLALADLDETALRTAVALLVASYATKDDSDALSRLWERSEVRDFLAREPLPDHDYIIVNPPYARTDRRAGLRTTSTNELFAYFLERVAETSKGFIAVTPAAYLNAPRYQSLRTVLDDEQGGGDVFVYDNVPDTLFRGYKYGSTNTSNTNFVRAAITVCPPGATTWRVTPILRWAAQSRQRMFSLAPSHLVRRRLGPDGEWAKVMRGTENLWDSLSAPSLRLRNLLDTQPTEFRLDVASTPRYYISATTRHLDRSSKHVLHFRTALDRDRAYLILNSSLPYWWWRTLDGGVTLPTRTLRSLPLPPFEVDYTLVEALRESEARNVVTKLNAGRNNENVKHPHHLVDAVNRCVLGQVEASFDEVYSSDLFAG
jgi:hypothetical protein